MLLNTVRELAHREHIRTTVGTTLKGQYRIVQYRIIQYIDGDHTHTHNTDTVNRRGLGRHTEVRIKQGRNTLIYVSPISSKTLRGASASSCSRSACSMAFSTFFLDVSWASPPSRNSSRMK